MFALNVSLLKFLVCVGVSNVLPRGTWETARTQTVESHMLWGNLFDRDIQGLALTLGCYQASPLGCYQVVTLKFRVSSVGGPVLPRGDWRHRETARGQIVESHMPWGNRFDIHDLVFLARRARLLVRNNRIQPTVLVAEIDGATLG